MPQQKRGRPPKLTQDLVERICRHVRATGIGIEEAALLSGVHRKTLWDWRQKGGWYNSGFGRNGKGPRTPADKKYGDFCNQLDQAAAKFESTHARQVGNAGKEDWRASAWILERRLYQRWGKPPPRGPEPAGEDGGVDVVAALRAALDEGAGGGDEHEGDRTDVDVADEAEDDWLDDDGE